MIKSLLYSLVLFMLLFCSCKTPLVQNKLRTGDLIFVETNDQNLSGAISRVTKDKKASISYDHIGIIEKKQSDVYVLHASLQKGSVKESLKTFLRDHEGLRLVIYRLKKEYKDAIPSAMQKAHQMLGKPYNTLYILNDSSYYCSDYIQRAFKEDSIFQLKPMTFINPSTGKIDTYWESFYKKYNKDVPEGELGCNPNGLATSDKIKKIFVLKQ